jgi:hypothetical protein
MPSRIMTSLAICATVVMDSVDVRRMARIARPSLPGPLTLTEPAPEP